MQAQNNHSFKGYLTQANEVLLENPLTNGDIPTWLAGSFISNGPAQFEIGKTHFNHWFDGLAMLKKFNFNCGKVSFQNKFLRSKQYTLTQKLGRLHSNEFATYANVSFLGRIQHCMLGLLNRNSYDNCNVNITPIAEQFIAMTENDNSLEFRISDLSTVGHFQYFDNMQYQLTSAHPHLDIASGDTINVAIEIGRFNKYYIYRITPNSKKREIIHTYISDKLFYMHSFSITANYIILFKSPLVSNKFKLLLGLPFNNTLSWKKNESSFFIMIDRRDGTIHEIETDPFICLHGANAYEYGKEIILDLVCHESGNPYNYLYLSNLRSEQPVLPHGVLKRYIVDINLKRCKNIKLSDNNQEFPGINYKLMNGSNYNFLYTSLISAGRNFFDSIQKLNVHTGKIDRWEKTDYYPGEGIFIANPKNQSEDDGLILSIAYNAANQCSSLVILDARTMQQVAEVCLPFHLPFGLHGNFYDHC